MLKIKADETITDGYRTYVLGRDGEFHFVSHGNHANHRVSNELLKALVGEGNDD